MMSMPKVSQLLLVLVTLTMVVTLSVSKMSLSLFYYILVVCYLTLVRLCLQNNVGDIFGEHFDLLK